MKWRPIIWMTLLTLFIIALGAAPAHALTYKQAKHMSQASVRKTIRREAHEAGYGKANTAALVTLAFRESRWHATSRSKRARFLGVFQLSRSMAKRGLWWKPGWNTRRAIRYIEHRYGAPRRALAHSYRHGWY